MEPNGIFLNRSFQSVAVVTSNSKKEQGNLLLVKSTKSTSLQNCAMSANKARSSFSPPHSLGDEPHQQTHQQEIAEEAMDSSDTPISHHPSANSSNPPQLRPRHKRPHRDVAATQEHSSAHLYEDDVNNNNWSNNNSSASSSSTPSVDNSPSATKQFKSKSGVQGSDSKLLQTLSQDENFIMQDEDDEVVEEEENVYEELFTLPTNSTSPSSLLSWKLPSFLCLPFTNYDHNDSYLHLANKSSKSAGVLSLTSLILVVMAVLLASVPAPVIAATATEKGDSSLATDDINSNDVTSHDYLTTSSSIIPVKLQAVTFSSPAEGTTSEDSISALLSASATGRTTAGGSGPSVTHQSVIEGLRQEPSVNDFADWKDADGLTGHGSDVESSSDKVVDSLLHREYEFKSEYPDMRNETREALQEEGSNHQPVVFVGGSGYVPPNSIRTRPSLEADPLWQARPLAESRYPVPLQSAWDRNYRNPFNMTRVQHIEAECQDDFMKIRVAFNGSFQGLIYSSGYSYDPDCVYVNGTGRDYYEYLIKLNRCGTLGASNHVEGRREPSKNFMWNTVTVQYNPMIEEEWDEHFKVTCEYGYDFWKTVTFPFLDVEVATGNPVVFTLTPPECYMEVRYGFGTAGTRVGGPVRVGDPLTLMINMRSQYDGFDIVVNDCYAHNGATKRIQLIDHYGCPVDSKLMSPFRGTWSHTNLYETQVYAYLKTFRFTGSPALYIECDVRMCHGQCPSQPCYWRNVKSVSKRSTDNQQMMITDSEKNSTLSENLSLFQALRVLQEDEDSEALKSNLDMHESVCMKTGAFTAMIGLSTFILVILTVSTMIMCFRLRRGKVIEERETATDIIRPYSHHVSQQSQHGHHQHRHHWSSAKPR